MKARVVFFTLISLSLLVVAPCRGQKVKEVWGEYTYYKPADMTDMEAKHYALEQAKIAALVKAFGSTVSESNVLVESNRVVGETAETKSSFVSIGIDEVNGVWLETIGDPQYKVSLENGQMVINVKVVGRAREIVSAPIAFSAKVLRNGTGDKFESAEFRAGDDMYLSFRSPVNGYLAVYLYDGGENVYCLLPYRSATAGSVPVKGGRSYLFFSKEKCQKGENPAYIDEYVLTCEGNMELNHVYVIFSPDDFTKALDNDGTTPEMPRVLDHNAFRKWLRRNQLKDTQMQVETKDIIIKK